MYRYLENDHLGAGTIGNLIAQAARCRGAAKVLITDVTDFRLAKAREVGIDVTCNVARESLADAVAPRSAARASAWP